MKSVRLVVMCLVLVGAAIMVGCTGPQRVPKPPVGEEAVMTVYLTGYSFWDNTPPGSAAIARPVLHKRAGGVGSYKDPITIAVGHRIDDGVQSLDFEPGTRFYLPELRKYAIVEDVCGDGPTPQLGPCHIGHKGHPWLDIYVGGRNITPEQAEDCMRSITGVQKVVINPRRNYAVEKGEIAQSTCAEVTGNS